MWIVEYTGRLVEKVVKGSWHDSTRCQSPRGYNGPQINSPDKFQPKANGGLFNHLREMLNLT